MADIAITGTSLPQPSNPFVLLSGVAGQNLTAGQCGYVKAADGLIYTSKSKTAGAMQVTGIIMDTVSTGAAVRLLKSGNLNINAVAVVAVPYVLAEDGGIAPAADLATGDTTVVIGVGITTTQILVSIINSGAVHA